MQAPNAHTGDTIMKRILLSAFAFVVIGTIAVAQNAFFPFWPVVGVGTYSCGQVNGVSNCTVPAGPTIVTGIETIPANTNSVTGGPANVYLSLASLKALPSTITTLVSPAQLTTINLSASSLSGGIVYVAAGTISAVNVTLPAAPINQQQYRISANRTITTLSVTAGGGLLMGGNTAPTVLTASTTVPQGYTFVYNLADTSWYRLQ